MFASFLLKNVLLANGNIEYRIWQYSKSISAQRNQTCILRNTINLQYNNETISCIYLF